jgi:hypothetical protein
MQRLLIGCMAVISWIHSAEAAQYEVIPTTYDHNVASSSYMHRYEQRCAVERAIRS